MGGNRTDSTDGSTATGVCLLLLNGPNLNMLGRRDPEHYGSDTLADIENAAGIHAQRRGCTLDAMQSNDEGQLITWIQTAGEKYNALLLNAGGYSHTSIAIRDAIEAAAIPCVEVHLSNIHARESFRRRSLISAVSIGLIAGFGSQSYILAVDAVLSHLGQPA